nr:MAG TPA: hypothetical protein [Caudoviricetes sp.]
MGLGNWPHFLLEISECHYFTRHNSQVVRRGRQRRC